MFGEGIGHFGWHVIFVVFRQNFIRDENTAVVQAAVRDNPLSFAKQVRQHAVVADGQFVLHVGQVELHFQFAVVTAYAVLYHQAANPKVLAFGCFAGIGIADFHVKHHVFLERSQR